MMTTPPDTICAISTPPGQGAIALVRLSGPRAIEVVSRIWKGRQLKQMQSHTAHLGTVTDETGEPLDSALLTLFRAPGTFTGEEMVELSVHGSTYVQQRLLEALCAAGARLAEPGEFTRRAFAAGRIDLARAEAVADLIHARTAGAHRLAFSQLRGALSARIGALHDSLLELASLLELELDFAEEDVTFAPREQLIEKAREVKQYVDRLAASFAAGDAIKNGIPTAIVGQPNAGKSTLLNLLLEDERAIVSDIPGTTRDTIEDTAIISGHTFRFIDTAGLRHTPDAIEAIGMERATGALAKASIVLWLVDATASPREALHAWRAIRAARDPHSTLLVLLNKTDRLPQQQPPSIARARELLRRYLPDDAIVVPHTNRDTHAIDTLRQRLIDAARRRSATEADVVVTNARHHQALLHASASITRAIEALRTNLPADLVAQDLRETLHHLSTITGTITTDTILHTIFSRFCIGK